MAVPQAIQDRRKAIEASIPVPPAPTTNVNPTPTVAPEIKQAADSIAQVQQVVEEVKQAAPTVDDQTDLWKKIEEAEARILTEAGRVKALQKDDAVRAQLLEVQGQNSEFATRKLQELRDEVDAVKKEKLELERKLRELQSPLPSKFEIEDQDLTPEEIASFEPSVIPLIQKLSRKELRKVGPVVQALVEEVQRLKEEVASVSGTTQKLDLLEKITTTVATKTAAENEKQFFRDALKDTDHKDWEKFVTTHVWKNFLDKEIPGKPGVHYGNILNHYRDLRNIQGIISVMDTFKNDVRGITSKRSTMAEPSGSGSQVNPNPAPPKRFKASQMKDMTTRLTKGYVSVDEYRKFKAEFKEALMNKNVEMDTSLN